MKQFVDELHANGQHWVAIQDAGIAADRGYKAFEEGTRDRVWITDANGEDYLGQASVMSFGSLKYAIQTCMPYVYR